MDSGLYKAATIGDFEPLEQKSQPLDHIVSKNNSTVLHIHLNSPTKRSINFVQDSLGKCPDLLWQTNNDGDIPLHIASKFGHVEIVELLIKEAKKTVHRDLETGEGERRMLRIGNKQNETALHLAIRGGFLDVAQEILKHEDVDFAYSANGNGETPLFLASRLPRGKVTIAILKKFRTLALGGPNGKTVLHAAVGVYFLNSNLFELMLSKMGCSVNPKDESGWTPLHCAAYVDNVLAARKILEKDKSSAYDISIERKQTALHIASCRGKVRVMKQIIEKCPDCCEITDLRGWNILHYAVISKSEAAVKMILQDSSLVYLVLGQDIKGYTPLHLLMVSFRRNSPLLSWIYSEKSGLPSQLLDHINSIHSSQETYKDKKQILEWIKDLGTGPLGETIEVGKSWKELHIEREEKVIPKLEKAKDSHLVAATLVATVTFAAAFTLPGGYRSDENDSNLKGTPILSRNAAFKAFVVTDAMAMVLSTCSVFIHFVMVLLGYKKRYYWLIRSGFWFVLLAMGAMVVAFLTGTYAVLAPNSMGLAVATCVVGLTFFVHVSYATIKLVFDFVKRDIAENGSSSAGESLGRLLHSAPLYLSFTLPNNREAMFAFGDDVTLIDKVQYEAAINGDFEVFCAYEKRPLDRLLDMNNNTILHIHLNSSTPRSKQFVLDVLSHCPDMLRHANKDGDIPLHIAASHGHLEMVELLVEQSKKPVYRDLEVGSEEEAAQRMLRMTNKQGETPLHVAIKSGNLVDVVKVLLMYEDPKYVYAANKYGETPLFLATGKQSEDIAVEILNKFESPDCGGPKGATAFHLAVFLSYRHENLFDLMLSKICDSVSQADENGWTPLHYAAYQGELQLVNKILAKDKSSAYATDNETNRTPLHLASCRGFGQVIKAIIEECPDCCPITDVKGWNVLHFAVFSNSEDTIKMVLKNPALAYLVYVKDIKGYTPLHLILASPNDYNELETWMGSDESGLDPQIFQDQISSIYCNPNVHENFRMFLEGKREEEVVEWMKDLGNDPFGKTITKRKKRHQRINERGEKVIPELEKAKDSHLVAAALVATVAFAAAFTLPGGYISDNNDPTLNGTPILIRNAAFEAFVTDAIAMVLLTSSVFIHFIMALLGYKQRYYWLLRSAFWFIVIAMGAMMVAFVTGTYAVLAPSSMGLAVAICVIGLTFFVHVLYAFIRLVFDFISRDQVKNNSSYVSESLRQLLVTAPRYLC